MEGIWVKRSLRYYRGRHLAFAGTVALTAAILSAALLTGASLQAGLRRGLKERLGRVRSAVFLDEGVFPASLAERVSGSQAALALRAELLNADGAVCENQARVIGVAVKDAPVNGRLRVFLNGRGSAVVATGEGAVRIEKPPLYSAEMPLGAVRESRLVRRAADFDGSAPSGLLTPDFSLQAASVPPVNAFLPYGALAEAVGVPGMANLLVSADDPEKLARTLAGALTPEDAGLALESLHTPLGGEHPSGVVVKSRRVFLPRGVSEVLTQAGLTCAPARFHLADAFEAGTNATPYGFVAAVSPGTPGVPDDLKDDEAVVNAWLADTLRVTTGDDLRLRWRRFEAGGRLVGDSRVFRIRAVIPTEVSAEAKRLMPVFPGLEGVDSCAAWDVGLPMDEEKLKDTANEAYWKTWRETPKVFLSYTVGKACFGTVFGEAMSARVEADAAKVREVLRALTPAALGFTVRPVWKTGLMAAQGSTDFKGLFVGMAFVLVAAALLLSSLALSLALETRRGEVALLGALGLARHKILSIMMVEWGLPLVGGAVVGGGLGATLARALIWSLGRFWRDAFAGAEVSFAFSLPVAAQAVGLSVGLAVAVMFLRVRAFSRVSPARLWQTVGSDALSVSSCFVPRRFWVWENWVGGALALASVAIMLWGGKGAANGAFFGAGFLLSVSLMLFVRTIGSAWVGAGRGVMEGPCRAGVRRAVLSPRRSMPVVVLLAVGVFLAVGILAMKHDPAAGCERTSSGSGGFASIVTSVAPLDRERGVELARRASGGTGAVAIRVHDGDEAGCLNMNRPASPRVLGLDTRAMSRLRAFEPEDSGGVWNLIGARLKDGSIPALAGDQAMLQYSLKAKAGADDGTVYTYSGGTAGRDVRIRIVGALPVRSGILQGSILVDESLFAAAFADESGYRMWLCDYAPYGLREAADLGHRGSEKERRIAALRHPEPGVTVETVEERLRLLGAVESTYLDMFLVLAGLGLVLGVVGIALVILRNVQDRQGELALLCAVGLPRNAVARLLGAEYGAMVLAGLVAGVVPAWAAIQPAARSLHGGLPWTAMAGVVGGLSACAALSVWLAAKGAAGRYGAEVLKEEV